MWSNIEAVPTEKMKYKCTKRLVCAFVCGGNKTV